MLQGKCCHCCHHFCALSCSKKLTLFSCWLLESITAAASVSALNQGVACGLAPWWSTTSDRASSGLRSGWIKTMTSFGKKINLAKTINQSWCFPILGDHRFWDAPYQITANKSCHPFYPSFLGLAATLPALEAWNCVFSSLAVANFSWPTLISIKVASSRLPASASSNADCCVSFGVACVRFLNLTY